MNYVFHKGVLLTQYEPPMGGPFFPVNSWIYNDRHKCWYYKEPSGMFSQVRFDDQVPAEYRAMMLLLQ